MERVLFILYFFVRKRRKDLLIIIKSFEKIQDSLSGTENKLGGRDFFSYFPCVDGRVRDSGAPS